MTMQSTIHNLNTPAVTKLTQLRCWMSLISPFRSLRKQAENSPSDIWGKTPAKVDFCAFHKTNHKNTSGGRKGYKNLQINCRIPPKRCQNLRHQTQFNPCMQVLYMPRQFSIKKQIVVILNFLNTQLRSLTV